MATDVEVGSCVLPRRLVATTDVPAALADAEVYPIIATGSKAILATLACRDRVGDGIEVIADGQVALL